MEIFTQSHTNAEKIILQRKFTLNRCMIVGLNLIFGLATGTDFKLAFINFKTALWLPIQGA